MCSSIGGHDIKLDELGIKWNSGIWQRKYTQCSLNYLPSNSTKLWWYKTLAQYCPKTFWQRKYRWIGCFAQQISWAKYYWQIKLRWIDCKNQNLPKLSATKKLCYMLDTWKQQYCILLIICDEKFLRSLQIFSQLWKYFSRFLHINALKGCKSWNYECFSWNEGKTWNSKSFAPQMISNIWYFRTLCTYIRIQNIIGR